MPRFEDFDWSKPFVYPPEGCLFLGIDTTTDLLASLLSFLSEKRKNLFGLGFVVLLGG